MTEQLVRPRSLRGRLGRLWGPLLIAAAILSSFALGEGAKLLTAPWSVPWLGGPKLVGTWEGPLRARLGAEYRVFLDLAYADREDTVPSASENLKGTAHVCTRTGMTYDYSIHGGADRSGRDVQLSLGYGDPTLSGLGFGLRGPWNGEVLAFRATHNPFDPDGVYRRETPSISSNPDDSFAPTELRRASLADFGAACQRLAAAPR